MPNITQITILPELPWWGTTVSEIKVRWKEYSDDNVKVTGIQLKWRNGDDETEWSEMIGPGTGEQQRTFRIEKGDWLTGISCGYRIVGGGQDGSLGCISFITHKGNKSELFGGDHYLIANENIDSKAGNIYGLSGTCDDGHVLSLGFHMNARPEPMTS